MRHLEVDGPSRPQPGILLPELGHPALIDELADFCEDLRRKEAYCLGFIPAESYPDAMRRHRLIIALENGEPAGFVLWAKRGSVLRFHQTAVTHELRRLKHATSIVTAALNTAEGRAAKSIKLRVAEDLQANSFWKAIGFKIYTVVPGGKTWKRNINCYRLSTRNRMTVAEKIIRGVTAEARRALVQREQTREDRMRSWEDRAPQACDSSARESSELPAGEPQQRSGSPAGFESQL